MRSEQVQTPEQALVYITDCTLATVDKLAMKTNPPRGELKRQISIAETSIAWIKKFNLDYTNTRIEDVLKFETVSHYAEDIHHSCHSTVLNLI